ncbi:hypothetical protein HYU90_02505 [Candidatus Collierbacteria bacterium]|nr:hypothetical protein [Candidatus Collierbacteria bacterium]
MATSLTQSQIAFGLDETILVLIGDLPFETRPLYTNRANDVQSNAQRYDLLYRLQIHKLELLSGMIAEAIQKARGVWYANSFQTRFITPKLGKHTGWLAHIQGQIGSQLGEVKESGVISTSFPPENNQQIIFLGRFEVEALERALRNGAALLYSLEHPHSGERQKLAPRSSRGTAPRATGKTDLNRKNGKAARAATNRANRAANNRQHVKGPSGKK